MGEQSSGVKLAEKPGLVGFAVPFGAIKRRKASGASCFARLYYAATGVHTRLHGRNLF